MAGDTAEQDEGPGQGLDTLMALVYDELRSLAERFMQSERPGHTLQPTALVHEAYVRLAAQDPGRWKGRAHFMAIASTMIRRVLIDHARRHGAAIRGGDRKRLTLTDAAGLVADREINVIALHEALEKLAAFDQRRSRVVELRYFGGLTNEETAEVLGVSKWTVVDDWELARAWLRRELTKEPQRGP
jgi:RNA polymerase sigma factor (TIGR02999 family)